MQITIRGYPFIVPDEVINYPIGYVVATEGEAHALRQTKIENLRNAFARRVSIAERDGELSDVKLIELQAEFDDFAKHYQFGKRSVSIKRSPLEREMYRIASEDIAAAHYAKHGERPDKDSLDEATIAVLAARHAEYRERAQASLRLVEQVGLEDLERISL